mmetsp:Transcript_32698/g.75634  ORF Transcript_32698/g.75634 Transcript_32698/m.75634 type:complete len:279 (+) Transcript_32698:841-1677(+)
MKTWYAWSRSDMSTIPGELAIVLGPPLASAIGESNETPPPIIEPLSPLLSLASAREPSREPAAPASVVMGRAVSAARPSPKPASSASPTNLLSSPPASVAPRPVRPAMSVAPMVPPSPSIVLAAVTRRRVCSACSWNMPLNTLQISRICRTEWNSPSASSSPPSSAAKNLSSCFLSDSFCSGVYSSYTTPDRSLSASCMSSSCLSSLITRSCFFTIFTGSVTVIVAASFCTRIIRCASLRVEMVSSRCALSPQMHENMRVLQLPPSESLSTFVSLVWR